MRAPEWVGRYRSAALLVGSRITLLGLSLVVSVVVARRLGPSHYGAYAAGAAIAAIPFSAGPFGADQMLLAGRTDRSGAYRLALRAGLLVSGAALILALGWPSIPRAARLCAVLLAVAGIGQYLLTIWFADASRRLRHARRAWRELGAGTLVAVLVLILAAAAPRPVAVAGGAAAANLFLGGLLLLRYLRRPAESVKPVGLGRQGAWYAASSVLYTAYFQIDVVLLASIRTPTQTADYRVAVNALTAVVVLAVVVNNDVLRPTLYRVAGSHALETARRALRLNAALGVATSLLLASVGKWMIEPIYGSHYAEARTLVLVLSIGLLPHFFNSWAGNVLVAFSQIRQVVLVQGVLTILNIAVNVAVIPSYGARGAAWATVATELAGVGAYSWLVMPSRLQRIVPIRHEHQAFAAQEMAGYGVGEPRAEGGQWLGGVVAEGVGTSGSIYGSGSNSINSGEAEGLDDASAGG